jgi:DNA transformation protein
VNVSDGDIAFETELFQTLGTISTRKMMGGLCLDADEALFALLDRDGRVYLRVKGALADDLLASGAEQFGRIGYRTLPDAALDDPGIACDWARRALREAED